MEIIHSISEFDSLIAHHEAVLVYFSSNSCQVCHVLKPKVEKMISECFPRLRMFSVESDRSPDLAAQHNVFTAPTLIVFFDGHEAIRKSRSFSIDELKLAIERPYLMCFGN